MRRVAGEADTIAFVVGLGLIVAGAWMIFRPAAFLIAGAVLCFVAFSLASRKAAEQAAKANPQ